MASKCFKLIFLLLLGCSGTAIAQITIAPTNIFIDSRSRFGSYMVINGSNTAQEVTIDFIFGYSKTDSTGKRVAAADEEVAKEYSAAEWIRAFPQNFTLQPGQRQTVRLRVSPPAGLEDGMYWARTRTSSSPLSPPLELQNDEKVTAQVGIRLDQITGLYYKKGNVSTGISIGEINTTRLDNGFLKILPDITREGNAPFIGSIHSTLYDSGGRAVRSSKLSTTIFFSDIVPLNLDISSIKSGTYTLELRFEAQRNDVAKENLVPMEPVTKQTHIIIE